jgi:hypothetical protein
MMAKLSSTKPVVSATKEPVAKENEDPKITGYHKLATFMGASRRMSIFRRFGHLTMLNLLTLQAELLNLEAEYREAHLENNKDDNTKIFSTSVDKLSSSDDIQWDIALDIRKKLNEYRMCLALQTVLIEYGKTKPTRHGTLTSGGVVQTR